MTRGSGTTSQQMRDAPAGAYFVWCNDRIEYPQQLARHLGRFDLHIVRPSWLTHEEWQGLSITALITDHAYHPFTSREISIIKKIRSHPRYVR